MTITYKISQLWGDNVPYYERYYGKGNGHPAGDIIIEGRVIRSLLGGIVVKDVDDPRGMGVTVTIWNPKLNLAERHCHMERNYLDIGDRVIPLEAIGVQGNTDTMYEHDHIEIIPTDDNGYRIKSAGVGGRIDPLFHILRAYGDPTHVDYERIDGKLVPVPWLTWQKRNPQWVVGKYNYGPSSLRMTDY